MPIPGDSIIGYMTLGRGVSIHRQDCTNIIHASEEQKKRLLTARWGMDEWQESQLLHIKFEIKAYDSPDLLKIITALVAKANMRIVAMQTQVKGLEGINHLQLVLEVGNMQEIESLYHQLSQVEGLISIKKQK